MRDGVESSGEMRAVFRGRLGTFDLDVAFTAPARGVTALFGPSGCGKTSVLRCAAGLNRVAEGHFSIAGEIWQDGPAFTPTHRRPLGYVFQEASLFPHLSVRDNLLYGNRRVLKRGAAQVVDFDEVTALLGIGHLLGRAPSHLSGGERQRVAIGRALLTQPKILLMDEPLAALDRMSKDDILPYLERLHDTLSIPALYVSHDIAEVERLADHLVLMRAGRVVASGPLAELQGDPSLPIARLRDAGVTIPAVIAGHEPAYGLTTLSLPGGTLKVPMEDWRGEDMAVGTRRRVRIAATDVSLCRHPGTESTILNTLACRVVAAERHDDFRMMAVVALGEAGDGARVLAGITRKSWETLGLAVGQPVFAQIKGVALSLRDRDGEG